MRSLRLGAAFASLLMTSPVFAAQKYIAISDSLVANSERLDVKSGTQWIGKIQQWRFGEYAVATSKNKGSSERTKSNLLKTKSESRTSESFAFLLTNGVPDSADVRVTHNTVAQSEQAVPLGKGWSLGTNQVLQESDSISAFIQVRGDSSESWSLLMTGAGGRDAEHRGGVQVLTNGTRAIALVLVSSDKNGVQESHSLISFAAAPAIGFEFVEEGRSLCAVQYFGGTSGGLAGMYKFVVWIRKDLDPRTKLMLAAAMTTLLQLFAQT